MKANRDKRTPLVLMATAAALFATACSERRVEPPPAPRPTARPLPSPAAPPAPARLDWRDMPITPGDWRWRDEGGQSVARFADGALVLRCDRSNRVVSLQRAGTAQGTVAITIATSNGNRRISATAQSGPPPVLSASFTAQDRTLDAIAFSRGRFAVEVPGLATLYVPSWPEVGRVIEDCR